MQALDDSRLGCSALLRGDPTRQETRCRRSTGCRGAFARSLTHRITCLNVEATEERQMVHSGSTQEGNGSTAEPGMSLEERLLTEMTGLRRQVAALRDEL